MSTQELDRLTKRLDSCFKRIKNSNVEIELQSDLARYLCVLVSGYLENAIYEILIDRAERKCAPEMRSFVEKSLDKWTNPNTEKINALFGMFSPNWKLAIEAYLVDENKEHINSLVGLRHAIAHGDTATITFSGIESYYKSVKNCITKISEITA